MGMDSTGGPSEAEKQRFLNKIQEWHELGFETDNLEFLLENDFDAFLRRRHQILKQQLKMSAPTEGVPPTEDATGGGIVGDKPEELAPPAQLTMEPHDDMTNDLDTEVESTADDELLLVGEPLSLDSEPMEEAVEESVIQVGKPRPIPKSKVHRSRKKEPEKEVASKAPTTKKKDAKQPEEDLDEEDEEPDVEEDETELEEEEPEVIDEEEEPRRIRQKTTPPTDDEPGGSVGGKIAAAVVVIIVIFSIFYFAFEFPSIDLGGIGGGGDDEKVKADFAITSADGFYHGTMIYLDASNSTGKNLKYQWTLDNDFEFVEGTRQSKRPTGYYISTENSKETKTITLKVSNSKSENTITEDITLRPKSFKIAEEKLSDRGEYKVSGSLNINNPEGLYTTSLKQAQYEADLTITNINIKFKTNPGQPMQMELNSANNVKDGFGESHSVYERSISQNLALSGVVTTKVDLKTPPSSVSIDNDLTGSMVSTDKSYTDFETHNTIYGLATNDVEITVPIKYSAFGIDEEFNLDSDDSIESFPDLRKNPMKFKLVDLSQDTLVIGDKNAIQVGNIIYQWNAEKVEYIYNRPVIKVNLTVDGNTKAKYNLQEFFTAFWIADEISQPIRTHLFTVQKQNGNTTTLNYVSEMTSFDYGITIISTQSCQSSTSDGHYFNRRPGVSYIPSSNWEYLPPTGQSTIKSNTSFDGFPQEQAIAYAKNNQDFIDFLGSHQDPYVVSGYCSANGEDGFPVGTLVWNLTFGSKDSEEGLNVLVTQNNQVSVEGIDNDAPPNSTSELEPLLTFSGSEDVLWNYSGEIQNIVFSANNDVDFENIEYGVRANMPYPNVDISSIGFIEYSKYSYLVTYQVPEGDSQRTVTIALDAETAQLLYLWDHKDSGLEIF
jgi:hypothetical protein